MCFPWISYISFTSKEYGAHQNRPFDQIWITFNVILSHDTPKWMRSHIDFISCEAMLIFKFIYHIRNIVINKNRFWNIKNKFRSSNPGFIPTLRCSILESLSNWLISLWIALHPVNPNNCNWRTLFWSLWRIQN